MASAESRPYIYTTGGSSTWSQLHILPTAGPVSLSLTHTSQSFSRKPLHIILIKWPVMYFTSHRLSIVRPMTTTVTDFKKTHKSRRNGPSILPHLCTSRWWDLQEEFLDLWRNTWIFPLSSLRSCIIFWFKNNYEIVGIFRRLVGLLASGIGPSQCLYPHAEQRVYSLMLRAGLKPVIPVFEPLLGTLLCKEHMNLWTRELWWKSSSGRSPRFYTDTIIQEQESPSQDNTEKHTQLSCLNSLPLCRQRKTSATN